MAVPPDPPRTVPPDALVVTTFRFLTVALKVLSGNALSTLWIKET